MTKTKVKPPKSTWLKSFKVNGYPPCWRSGYVQAAMREWAGHRCENCGVDSSAASLHVHHLRWADKHDCRWENLVVVCVKCHTKIHNRGWQPGVEWQERWGAVPQWVCDRNLDYGTLTASASP